VNILAVAVIGDDRKYRCQLRDEGDKFVVVVIAVETGYVVHSTVFPYGQVRQRALIAAIKEFEIRLWAEHFKGIDVASFSLVLNPDGRMEMPDAVKYTATADTFEIACNRVMEQVVGAGVFNVRSLFEDPMFMSALSTLKTMVDSSSPVEIALFLRSQ
jgi:hypothetical protein